MDNPNDEQVGGDHYKKYPIQPWDFIMKNNIPWAEGCILEYVVRWREKGGIEDLRKAKHLIEKMIEIAGWGKEPKPPWTIKARYEPACDCERCSAE